MKKRPVLSGVVKGHGKHWHYFIQVSSDCGHKSFVIDSICFKSKKTAKHDLAIHLELLKRDIERIFSDDEVRLH